MSKSFKNISSANRTFGTLSNIQDAGEYIKKKQTQATYCVPNSCSPSFKVSSQNQLLMLRASTKYSLYPCLNSIDTSELYINLITALDLSNNVIPIIDTSATPGYPAIINTSGTTYTKYNIDPSGNLFGNTTCGLNNFVNYLVSNPPPSN